MQGLLGWFMVKSGLTDNPYVSQYRLTAHLLAAFLIYAYIFWAALDLFFPRPAPSTGNASPLRRFALAVTGLLTITVMSGGFVAGLKAGFAYNTFPLMDGSFIPDNMFALETWYLNFFDNIATVQFDHRLLAEISLIVIIILWFIAKRYDLPPCTHQAFNLLLVIVLVQVALGISTLLLVVPTWLGATHQAGALVLFTSALYLNHTLTCSRQRAGEKAPSECVTRQK